VRYGILDQLLGNQSVRHAWGAWVALSAIIIIGSWEGDGCHHVPFLLILLHMIAMLIDDGAYCCCGAQVGAAQYLPNRISIRCFQKGSPTAALFASLSAQEGIVHQALLFLCGFPLSHSSSCMAIHLSSRLDFHTPPPFRVGCDLDTMSALVQHFRQL
jgi:hypothetical protein